MAGKVSSGIRNSGIRNVAIVGPYSSGKTTLLESLLSVTGTLSRKGSIEAGNTVGDSSAEARNHKMSVELSAAQADHGGLRFNFIDCPGSIEFAQETWNALVGVDAALVVCEPNPERVLTLAPLLKFLDDWEIPHLLLINKIDRLHQTEFMDLLHTIQSVSSRPLIPHQYPIRRGEDVVGFIDLVSEQAFHFAPGQPAAPVEMPAALQAEEQAARAELLEALADFDDHLLEELLEDIAPPEPEIVGDLKWELSADLIVPVFLGQASEDYGVRPLLEALVQECPGAEETALRRGMAEDGTAGATDGATDGAASATPLLQVLKTFYLPQTGKLSLARVWRGQLKEGQQLNGERPGGIYRLMGQQMLALTQAQAGDIVALSRLENAQTGDTLTVVDWTDDELSVFSAPGVEPLSPVYALAIAPQHRKDEVKLSAALNKLMEEDPSLRWEQHGDTHEVILWGQGNIHLQINLERLGRKYNLPMTTHAPRIPYRETIRRQSENVHGRYKHQTGGHGQFGDVFFDIQPLPRGQGFSFDQKIVGGVVPRQFIPGVETGVREYLGEGPLGFPVVDVGVTLTNGSYHSVDSSEQAFKQAARIAMQTGMPHCQPTLLEPILSVEISIPSEFTSSVLKLISGRRGQILGYDLKADWEGWEAVSAYLPQAEMQDLIVELRSLTLGVGFFAWQPDHFQEVPDKIAERVLAKLG